MASRGRGGGDQLLPVSNIQIKGEGKPMEVQRDIQAAAAMDLFRTNGN